MSKEIKSCEELIGHIEEGGRLIDNIPTPKTREEAEMILKNLKGLKKHFEEIREAVEHGMKRKTKNEPVIIRRSDLQRNTTYLKLRNQRDKLKQQLRREKQRQNDYKFMVDTFSKLVRCIGLAPEN